MADDILAEIDARGPRRVIGIGLLLSLGGVLLYLAFLQPPASVLWHIFLIAMGGASLWMAYRLQIATQRRLILTKDTLCDSDGRVIARVSEVVAVNRGAFAIKPSNGFVLRLSNPMPRGWQPGLWWCVGRRVAVGGVTPASQTRPMADILAILVAQRAAADQ